MYWNQFPPKSCHRYCHTYPSSPVTGNAAAMCIVGVKCESRRRGTREKMKAGGSMFGEQRVRVMAVRGKRKPGRSLCSAVFPSGGRQDASHACLSLHKKIMITIITHNSITGITAALQAHLVRSPAGVALASGAALTSFFSQGPEFCGRGTVARRAVKCKVPAAAKSKCRPEARGGLCQEALVFTETEEREGEQKKKKKKVWQDLLAARATPPYTSSLAPYPGVA